MMDHFEISSDSPPHKTEIVSIESFTDQIPALRQKLAESMTRENAQQFIANLTDSDYVNIYTELALLKKRTDVDTEAGFIFEIIGRRFIKMQETHSKLYEDLKDLFLFMFQDINSAKLWGESLSNPDDLEFKILDEVEITKLYEFKISKANVHNRRAKRQKNKSIDSILSLAKLFNNKSTTQEPGSGLAHEAVNRLRALTSLQIRLSPEFKYVYVLPKDVEYNPTDQNTQTINVPLTKEEVFKVREVIIGHFKPQNI